MIRCSNCGESNEKNLDFSYDHSLNGVVYCTCRSCKSKFVVQEGEGAILGKYIADRSKFFTVLESAKLNKDYSGSPTYELRKLISAYSAVAEIDPIYHWYKIEIITAGFTDRTKVGEAEKEFLKIPETDIYFVSKEDETRHELYRRQYDAYRQEIKSDENKRRKKKRTVIKLIVSLIIIIALAGAALGLYSCYRKSIRYTIALNYVEVQGSVYSIEADAGSHIEGLPSVILPSEKYYLEFTGWYTEKDCGGIRVADEDGLSDIKLNEELISLSKNKTIQLYAGYRYKDYTVTFYSADGSSVIDTVTVSYGTSVDEIGTGITYGDITVLSWSEQIGGSVYAGTVKNNISLYASVLSVTLSFDCEGGNDIPAESYKVGDTVTLPSPEKPYYAFAGWLADGQNVGTSYTVPDKKVTLVAQWTRTHYTVTYDSNGGDEVQDEVTRAGTNVALPVLTRQYYGFDGWTYNGVLIEDSLEMPEKNISLVAQWTRTHYAVTYDSNGGDEVEGEMTRAGTNVALPVLTRQYYRFNGWAYNGVLIEDSLEMPEKNISLVAQWERTHYKVTFYNSYGATVEEYVLMGDSCNVPQAEREGYDFVCWVAPVGTEYNLSIVPESDITLNPKWTPKSYSVTYNANGGAVTGVTSNSVIYGNSFSFPIPVREASNESYSYTYSKNNKNSNTVNMTVQYIFEGWYTAENGGTKLTDKSGNSIKGWNIAYNAVVYAHWTPLTVKYHKDSGMYVYDAEDCYDLAATVKMKSVTGYSVSEFIAMGYTRLNLNMFINLREVNDGYQELYLCNSYTSSNKPASSSVLWSVTNIEHTRGGGADTSSWTHYFTASIDLTKVTEDLYFVVNAHGDSSDTWILNYMDVYFTIA